jgi:hypothetical protein
MKDEMAAVADGRIAGALLELLEVELNRREQAIRAKVWTAINAANSYLEPQLAVQAWVELKAVHDLRQALTRRQQAGRSAGARETERGRLSLQGAKASP